MDCFIGLMLNIRPPFVKSPGFFNFTTSPSLIVAVKGVSWLKVFQLKNSYCGLVENHILKNPPAGKISALAEYFVRVWMESEFAIESWLPTNSSCCQALYIEPSAPNKPLQPFLPGRSSATTNWRNFWTLLSLRLASFLIEGISSSKPECVVYRWVKGK